MSALESTTVEPMTVELCKRCFGTGVTEFNEVCEECDGLGGIDSETRAPADWPDVRNTNTSPNSGD